MMSEHENRLRELIFRHDRGELTDVQLNFWFKKLGITDAEVEKANRQIDIEKFIISVFVFSFIFLIGFVFYYFLV